jgi:hypothetical protein
MFDPVLRLVPLGLLYPFRLGAARLRRGGIVRGMCVLAMKNMARANRGRLGAVLSEIRPLDMPALSFDPTDSMVIDAVFWTGVCGYEGIVSRVWVDLCRQSRGVLEIGGNVGLFTVLGAAERPGSYTVVEPVPEVARVLRNNLRRNGLQEAVRLLEGAVVPGGEARPVMLNVPDEHRGAPVGAHLVEQVEVTGRSSKRVISVRGCRSPN